MGKIKDFKLGATGKYTHGKLDETDEGELKLAIAADIDNRVIRIVFGQPVAWIGLPIEHAKGLIKLLNEKIVEIEKQGN